MTSISSKDPQNRQTYMDNLMLYLQLKPCFFKFKEALDNLSLIPNFFFSPKKFEILYH